MRDSPTLTGTPKRALSHRRPANHAQHSQGRCEPPSPLGGGDGGGGGDDYDYDDSDHHAEESEWWTRF